MDWIKELYDENEKPLDRLVEGYSHTSVFRKIDLSETVFLRENLKQGMRKEIPVIMTCMNIPGDSI